MCTKCYTHYPDAWQSFTCKVCGGAIAPVENSVNVPKYYFEYYANDWNDWLKIIKAAPPHPMNEKELRITESYFNGCAFCGCPDIEGTRLFVPTLLGGKYYTYNVLPICGTCQDRLKGSAALANPLPRYHRLFKYPKREQFDKIMAFLYGRLLDAGFTPYQPDNDQITFVCRVSTTSSNTPFNGITARLIEEVPNHAKKITKGYKVEPITDNEMRRIAWRLI